MKPIIPNRRPSRRIDLRLCLSLLFVVAITATGKGVPPIDPLPAPDYSFGLESWTVEAGIVDARDVLTPAFPDCDVVIPGAALGLDSPCDDLDALSGADGFVSSEDTFVLLFSVSANSVGAVPPDPMLIDLNVPYNVADQAARGHAAGDQFMSTILFTLSGAAGGPLSNNVLVRNNYDEGGTDFCAQPPTSASETAVGEALDIVNATARLPRADEMVVDVYFSVTADSPSLGTLPYWSFPSGADIYFDEEPAPYLPPELYAAHEYLELVEDDDIDALIVFDNNENGQFDGSDRILFSLAPGCPSLDTIPGASSEGAAADVFVAAPGQPPALFAAAADLGLGDPNDNIDALDFALCDDVLFCAAQHGIRTLRGDLDGDGDVDLTDLAQLLANFGMTSGATHEDGDLDGDEDVDLADLAALLSEYGLTSGSN